MKENYKDIDKRKTRHYPKQNIENMQIPEHNLYFAKILLFILNITLGSMLLCGMIWQNKLHNSFLVSSFIQDNLILSITSHASSILYIMFGKIGYIFPFVLLLNPNLSVHICIFLCIASFNQSIQSDNGIIINIIGNNIQNFQKYYVAEGIIILFCLITLIRFIIFHIKYKKDPTIKLKSSRIGMIYLVFKFILNIIFSAIKYLYMSLVFVKNIFKTIAIILQERSEKKYNNSEQNDFEKNEKIIEQQQNADKHNLFVQPQKILKKFSEVSSESKIFVSNTPQKNQNNLSQQEDSSKILHISTEFLQNLANQMDNSHDPEQEKELLSVLNEFGVFGEICNIKVGPIVTLYEFKPVAGTKSSRIIGLADDIARSMSAISIRIAIIPGKNAIGIEIPNQKKNMVYIKPLIENFDNKYAIPIALGVDISGTPVIVDLAKMPHLLVAGTTGSGKSVGINAMILSILYKFHPDNCKLILIDPKVLELSVYEGIPHLLSPVVIDPKKAVSALQWAVHEMEKRYRIMSQFGARNLDGYNKIVENSSEIIKEMQVGFDDTTGEPIIEKYTVKGEKMPFIVIVVDEMADLMLTAGKEVENAIQRLAQMARAAGIHLITATQRPSVDVVTGIIKANFPTRISFRMSSSFDSKTILGEKGAEQLLGAGDMLYMNGSKSQRVHAPFVSDAEVEKTVSFLKNIYSSDYALAFEDSLTIDQNTESDEPSNNDPLYQKAVEIVISEGKVSISYIQRKLGIGYNRSAKFVEKMEEEGIVSRPNKLGRRSIL